ncbi:MAG: prolyl oligopeptidase family serine peptidase [Candidatus Acidiferrales bacterium]
MMERLQVRSRYLPFVAAVMLLGGAHALWFAPDSAAQADDAANVQAPAPAPKTLPTPALPWKPEDVVNQEDAGGFDISNDGRWAVWVKTTADQEKNERVGNLYLSSLTEKKEVQWTRGTEQVSQPRWSPSGNYVGFLSTRTLPKPNPKADSTQLWLISAAGGEPWPVTESERGIRQFEWIDDDTILFSAEENPSLYDAKLKDNKDDSNVVDDAAHTAPVRLFELSIQDKKVKRITDNDDWIEEFEVSRDKTKVVMSAQRELSYEWDQKTPPVSYLVNLATGERKQIFEGQRIVPNAFVWARDNSGFYVAAPYSSDPNFLTATVERVYFYDLGADKVVEVNLDWDRGLGGSLQATEDGFIALLADGVYTKAARYTRHGSTWSRKSVTGEHEKHYFSLVLGDDAKTVIYKYSTASLPTQFYRARLEGTRIAGQQQFTELNPSFKDKPIAKTEVIHWTGANDEEVEGILYYPDSYKAGRGYPLIVATHGGPAGVDRDEWAERWAYAPNQLTERNAFVLKTNYHGSTGYGLKWVESICCGHYYDLEIPDIERGVDSLIGKGFVDPDQIGAMGWSNGSILSIQLTVTNPERYKAASVGAGDVEWLSDWANVDFGEAFDHYYFGKSPLEDPELYLKKSPLFKLDQVKTPTLIFFGTIDRQVPTEQGWTHYRALYTVGKAPVKFILFPGEAHGPRKLTHQLRKMNEELAWFDQYLFKINPPENEALKKNSPLEAALARRSIRKDGAMYGMLWAPEQTGETVPVGTLIPETVKRGAIRIGRFEVTRAQYAAFDKDYKFEPGTENFPANGIAFEQARAYCKWLSDLTGETYRLPNATEVGTLYKIRPNENTLDYWAGYSPNPEDAKLLQNKVNELAGDAPLLREVGSFSGEGEAGEELVFDLGGNVAEWVVAPNGGGKTMGGSADRPADPAAAEEPTEAAYTGFRVVHIAPAAKSEAPKTLAGSN